MLFFKAYDDLSEEGTATTVCKKLDEVADISIPGKVRSRLRMQLTKCLLQFCHVIMV